MQNITATEAREITRKANESISFAELKFPYIDTYEKLNEKILEKAKNGENSISFDFVDYTVDKQKTLEEIQREGNRIYIYPEGGHASHNVYNYPNYLIARGFNVEVRKSLLQHGYISKSYYISW